MKIVLKRMLIEHFKGITNKECTFNTEITDICGCNGSGKTTIANAIFFVLADCDYQLNSKPTVQPIGDEESRPHIKIWMDVDGREITVEKTQKSTYKVDEDTGKKTVTTSNTYAINDVPKAYRDFVQYFSELGIDLEKILVLMHPDAFTKDSSAKGREKMREALFEMATNQSDAEIITGMGGCDELKGFLNKGYKVEEVKAMQTATKKKIETENGKANELIDARIQGLVEGKADVSGEEESKKLAILEARQAELKAQLEKPVENPNEGKIKELKDKVNRITQKARDQKETKRRELLDKYEEYEVRRRELKVKLGEMTYQTQLRISEATRLNTDIKELRDNFKKESSKDIIVEESCPYCGQKLPEESIESARKKLMDAKTSNLESMKKRSDQIQERITQLFMECDQQKDEQEKIEDEINKLISESEDILQELKKYPKDQDVDVSAETEEINAEISRLEAETSKSSADEKEAVKEAYNKVLEEITGVKTRIAAAKHNEEIDEKIKGLRAKKLEDEGVKAQAEKVLFQIAEFEKFKNRLLTFEINEKFALVEWKLFDVAKNGEYKEVCIPTYRGKDIGSQTNAALTVAMKIDIANSFQKFWGIYTPIIVDEAERLDKTSRNHIVSESQIIYLTVTNDEEIKGI